MKYYTILFILSFIGQYTFGQQADSTKKQYLGVLTLAEKYRSISNWTDTTQAIVTDHFNRLLKFHKEGRVIFAGRTEYQVDNPDMMGLVIFFSKNDKEAEEFMNEDPAVKNKIMQMRLHPYTVAIDRCK